MCLSVFSLYVYRRSLWQTYSPNPLSLPPVTLAQAQDWASCGSLQQYVNEHPDCYILHNENEPCSELDCDYDHISDFAYLDFHVRRCADPVTVGVYVQLYDGEYTNVVYNQSETFQFLDYSFSAILERNATHLAFMVSLYDHFKCCDFPTLAHPCIN